MGVRPRPGIGAHSAGCAAAGQGRRAVTGSQLGGLPPVGTDVRRRGPARAVAEVADAVDALVADDVAGLEEIWDDITG